MTQQKQVEFLTDARELQSSVQQLLVNREEYHDTDIVEICVGTDSVELRAVGTETAISGTGKQSGIARLPISVLSKIGVLAMQFKKKTITVLLKDGQAKIETAVVSHPAINLDAKGSAPILIPVNASDLDILATAEVVSKEDISDAGLKERLKRAIESREAAVERAVEALDVFGVQKDELLDLVNKHIKELAKGVKKSLGRTGNLHVVRPN
jgi:hypothetical protein